MLVQKKFTFSVAHLLGNEAPDSTRQLAFQTPLPSSMARTGRESDEGLCISNQLWLLPLWANFLLGVNSIAEDNRHPVAEEEVCHSNILILQTSPTVAGAVKNNVAPLLPMGAETRGLYALKNQAYQSDFHIWIYIWIIFYIHSSVIYKISPIIFWWRKKKNIFF